MNDNNDATTRPSLLSHNYIRPQGERLLSSNNTVVADATTVAANNNNFSLLTTYQVFQQCSSWHPKYTDKPHPLISMLEWGKKKQPRGWARWHDAHLRDNRTKRDVKGQLTAEQNALLINMKKETDNYGNLTERAKNGAKKNTGINAMLQHAFAVGKSKVEKCISKFNERDGKVERKKRSDAGKTLTNSKKKRDQVVTPNNYFKKLKRKHHPGEVFTDAELNAAYANLSEADRLICAQGADGLKDQLNCIEGEVQRVMQHTNGCISWRRLAEQIAGGAKNVQPIGHHALARWVMGTEGFRYTETQTLPQCTTERTKRIRVKWAVAFHIFWEGARMVAQKVQVLYTNIDEKWFYSLVIRRHNKVVPFFGCAPVYHRIHHKNNTDKLLVICVVGFAPTNNDMRSGGIGYKILMTRCGGMVQAKKDSYMRVYNDDGTYSYPRIAENRLRTKGEDYFENWEICGSRSEKGGEKKFNLSKWVREEYTPALHSLAQKIEEETGKRVVIRDGWDNATPHVEMGLQTEIKERNDERGWLWKVQPPNSPLTNSCDAGLFPSLAKIVTAMQGLNNRGLYLSTEKLWELLQKGWDQYPVEKIARLFIHQTQIAAAILECNGGDDFVKQRNGLSYGVRKVTQPLMEDDENYTPNLATMEAPVRKVIGVKVCEVIEGVDVDKMKKLKYAVPNVDEYDISKYLDFDELQIIAGDFDDTDYDNFTDEQKERYNKFGKAFEDMSAIEYPTNTNYEQE